MAFGRTWFAKGGRAPFDPARPLGFIHIPKTAGTSVTAALTGAFAHRQAIWGFDRVLFGDYTDFASLGEEVRRVVYLSADGLPAADLIAGHMAYSTFRQRYESAQFITVLREPFSRLLSHWLFWRGHNDAQLVPWGSWGDVVRLSRLPLAAFLSARPAACQTDNLAVRMLLWPHKLIPEDDFIDPRHDRRLLAEARDRLARIDLVDVVENPGLLDRLQRWLGCPLVLERRNETASLALSLRQKLEAELTPEALDLAALRSRLDLELWCGVVRSCLPGADPARLRERTLLRNVARYAALMAPPPTAP